MKKFLAIAMAVLLVFALAACGGDTGSSATPAPADTGSEPAPADTGSEPADEPAAADEPAPAESGAVALTPEDPTTISIWITTAESMPSNENKLTQLLKDRLGVTLEYEITTPDNADMRIGTLLAGGEFPDLVGTTDLQYRMIEQGALIRLDDLLNSGNYPLLKEHVDPYIRQLSYDGGEVDEGFYIFPNYNRYYGEITGGIHYGSGMWLQKAVLADAGYPSLDDMTIEKYFKLIEDYAAKNPTINGLPTIGYEVLAVTGREWGMSNPPLFLAGQPNNGGVTVDENNVAQIYADKQIAYDWFKALNGLNAKGLVDTEAFTQTLDQYLAKLAGGNVLAMHDQRWGFGQANDALVERGELERTWVSLMPTYEGAEPYYADRDVMNIHQGVGVSVSCEQVDKVMLFLETMMSEEWQKILSWGIEGEDYLVGDDGIFYRTQEMRDADRDLTWRADNRLMALRDILPKHQGTYTDGNAYGPGDDKTEFFESLQQYDKDFLNAYGKQTWKDFINQPPDNPVYYPCWNITLTNEAQIAGTQMTDASMLYLPQVIMADPAEFDNVWAQYVAAIQATDVALYESEINAGIQQRIEKWGN